jgi:hypothetical protein
MKIWAFLALAAAASTPAQADLTATYVPTTPDINFKMTMEVAANGDVRADINGPGAYVLRRQGRSYFIVPDAAGPVVEDSADIGAVMQEEMAKMSPHFCDQIAQAPVPKLVSLGTMTVAGRTGEAFGLEGRPATHPAVIISHDPALAPLGAAMSAQFRASSSMLGSCSSAIPAVVQMQALLDSGAPLEFGGMRLETVETGAIDPARFVLPAAPATRDQVRAMIMRPKGAAAPTAPPAR